MSNREPHLLKIIKFLKQFKTEVELRNSINLYDINIHAEYFYRDLFNLVYDWDLKNLNAQAKSQVQKIFRSGMESGATAIAAIKPFQKNHLHSSEKSSASKTT